MTRRAALRLFAPTLVVPSLFPKTSGDQEDAIFCKIRLVVANGGKVEEKEVILRLLADRLIAFAPPQKPCIVCAPRGGGEQKAFLYKDITAADYSFSKHPRWRAGLAAALAVGVFAAPVFFTKSRSHWLTLRTDDDFIVLRLHKTNAKLVIPAFEVRSKVKVETVGER